MRDFTPFPFHAFVSSLKFSTFPTGILTSPNKKRVHDYQIDTGILHWEKSEAREPSKINSADSVDWVTPVSSENYDWSRPDSCQTSSMIDW